MPVARLAKSVYSESEAAQELGISVERLRTLIRTHVLTGDDEVPPGLSPMFQASDLLILRFLSGSESMPIAQH
jgi:hypothetical protein